MGEVAKLQQHLHLLKHEYSKLQAKHKDLETRYSAIAATSGHHGDQFPFRLLATIAKLHESPVYSDIKIVLSDGSVSAHRLVLESRSALWSSDHLEPGASELDWTHVRPEIARDLIRWLYLDEIGVKSEDDTLDLIKVAHEFKLHGLVRECEQLLVKWVDVRSCVKFYSVAEEIGAEDLKEYCSGLISTHWDDLNSSDFEHMSGPLLYQMLKSKTKYTLHTAVRLQREDVVFLCLVENVTKLSDVVNLWSPSGELPLDLALRAHNASIAATLVQHNADLNIRDSTGDTLLHRAIRREDSFAALFLLDENNCDATLYTRDNNDSALHLAAGTVNLEQVSQIAERLIDKGVNVNCQNRLGLAPLHIAIQADNRESFDLLLAQRDIDPNVKTTDEHTPLYYALLKYESDPSDGHYVSRLVDRGAVCSAVYSSANQKCDSLLQVMIRKGAEQAAMFLCDYLAGNVNHVNADGESALHGAATATMERLIDRILSVEGVDANLLTYDGRQSALHYAVKANATSCIARFNGGRVDFNVRDSNGDTPISLALNEGRPDLVPLLIAGGADVNVRNGRDFTLLHQAIMKEDGATALFLLDNGADINAKTAESETPLQLAIHCRLGDVVDALCIRGVDMSAPDRLGDCALWAALDSGQDDIASVLVRHGADTDCWGAGPDGCRQTLLHRAIDENKEAAAIFLIQSGCDLDSARLPGPNGEGGDEAKDKASPLHLCCQWGLETVVRTLVEHKANVNSRDSDNKTPIHAAIENQHPEIIALLLSVPDVDLTMRDRGGLTPFATALAFRNNKAAQAILDKLPSAAEQFDAKGHNFLHTAIKRGDIESALFLLTVRVDVNSRVRDEMLTPPLHLAARHGNETLVRSLILAGARLDDRDSRKRTALHVGAEVGNAPAVSALLQNGTDFDAADSEGDNALHVAVREGHLGVVRTLLTESRVDAEAPNLKGRNPMHELCKYGKDNAAAICELFLECMPQYPINKTDIMGNSPLLLAYMRGNANLCRVLVKAQACLATENNERVTIFNYQVPSKQLLTRLLDQLAQPASWTNTDLCQECGKSFSLTVRTHHCRHCGRALCSRCSDQEVPIIKFGENKPVRVCRICFDVLKSGAS